MRNWDSSAIIPLLVIEPTSGQMREILADDPAIGSWTEIGPSTEVREQAIRLLRVHQLGAADAVQLAAAIIAAEFQPSGLDFVTLDRVQGAVADKEGFRVIG